MKRPVCVGWNEISILGVSYNNIFISFIL